MSSAQPTYSVAILLAKKQYRSSLVCRASKYIIDNIIRMQVKYTLNDDIICVQGSKNTHLMMTSFVRRASRGVLVETQMPALWPPSSASTPPASLGPASEAT